MNDEVKKSGPLTVEELSDLVNRSINNFGAPNQMCMSPSAMQAFNKILTSKDILHPAHSRIKNMLHGKLKLGTIDWNTATVLEDATVAFSRMGVFRHA